MKRRITDKFTIVDELMNAWFLEKFNAGVSMWAGSNVTSSNIVKQLNRGKQYIML